MTQRGFCFAAFWGWRRPTWRSSPTSSPIPPTGRCLAFPRPSRNPRSCRRRRRLRPPHSSRRRRKRRCRRRSLLCRPPRRRRLQRRRPRFRVRSRRRPPAPEACSEPAGDAGALRIAPFWSRRRPQRQRRVRLLLHHFQVKPRSLGLLHCQEERGRLLRGLTSVSIYHLGVRKYAAHISCLVFSEGRLFHASLLYPRDGAAPLVPPVADALVDVI